MIKAPDQRHRFEIKCIESRYQRKLAPMRAIASSSTVNVLLGDLAIAASMASCRPGAHRQSSSLN